MRILTNYVDLVRSGFYKFIQEVTLSICCLDENFKVGEVTAQAEGYDPYDPANKERALRCGWNAQAKQWVAVESIPTYFASMIAILQRIDIPILPPNKKVRIASLGSGPGLYEIFLAYCFHRAKIPVRIYCFDYAEEMIRLQQKVLESNIRIEGTSVSALRQMVVPIVADMSTILNHDSEMDIVICNNSLQWVNEWQKAIQVMARMMNPKGIRQALLIIHPHAMRVKMGDTQLFRDHLTLDKILDEMEKMGFQPTFQRIMAGRRGTGQAGGMLDRTLAEFKFHPDGVPTTWRNMSITKTSITGVSLTR